VHRPPKKTAWYSAKTLLLQEPHSTLTPRGHVERVSYMFWAHQICILISSLAISEGSHSRSRKKLPRAGARQLQQPPVNRNGVMYFAPSTEVSYATMNIRSPRASAASELTPDYICLIWAQHWLVLCSGTRLSTLRTVVRFRIIPVWELNKLIMKLTSKACKHGQNVCI
jgi:hypothetical protein